MAAGYDIGVSSSNAQSFSTPQTADAGTTFNFASPGASGDWYSQSQEANPVSTAVATTKSPGSTTDVGTSQGGLTAPAGPPDAQAQNSGVLASVTGQTGAVPNYLLYAGLLGLLYVAYLKFKK
jgi:hypothetical protein